MIFDSHSVQEFLYGELDQRIQNNPQYSQRAFARDLQVSPGALSEILHGQRPITAKFILKLKKALGLSTVEVNHLLSLLGEEGLGGERAILRGQKKELSSQLFRVISEWYHFAILNLMDLKKFKWRADWISHKLGVSFVQARSAMKRLEEIEMVERKGKQIRPSHDFVYSSEDIPSSAIRKYHREMLEFCIAALETQNIEKRSILGTGMAIKKSDLPKLKKEISDFHKKILHKYSKKSADHVYHFESALICLSKEDQDG